MSKLIVELPDDLHASLKRQAAEERQTLKTIVITLLDQYVHHPTASSPPTRPPGLCGAWKDARSAKTIAAELRGARRWWVRER